MVQPASELHSTSEGRPTDPVPAELPGTEDVPASLECMPQWVDFQGLQPVACPCGLARRAFHDRPDVPYTMHVTEILDQAKPHYHKQMTETYFILECEKDASLELDGKRVPVVPGTACLIPPGVVHRAMGRMKVLIVVTPKFDSNDEYIAEECVLE